MIKIEMLRCFSTVAETGSLAEAADRLGRTPSAVSMTLKKLEEHLGRRLFEKDRKNKLSELGEYVLEQAQNELRQFDSAVSAIESYASASTGLVRVAAVPSVAGLVFPWAIAEMTRAHPGVKIELRDMDSASILHALARGQIEVGIGTSTAPPRNVRRTHLFSDDFGLMCAREHPLALQPEAPDWSDLARYRFVGNDLCKSIPDPGLQSLLSGAQVSAHNTLSLVAMVRSRDWVTVLPRSVIQIEPDHLAFRPVRNLSARRAVSVLSRADRTNGQHVEAFVGIVASRKGQFALAETG